MKPALTSTATRGFAWKPLDTGWSLPSGESLAGFALDRGLLASSLFGTVQPPSAESDSGFADGRAKSARREPGHERICVGGRR